MVSSFCVQLRRLLTVLLRWPEIAWALISSETLYWTVYARATRVSASSRVAAKRQPWGLVKRFRICSADGAKCRCAELCTRVERVHIGASGFSKENSCVAHHEIEALRLYCSEIFLLVRHCTSSLWDIDFFCGAETRGQYSITTVKLCTFQALESTTVDCSHDAFYHLRVHWTCYTVHTLSFQISKNLFNYSIWWFWSWVSTHYVLYVLMYLYDELGITDIWWWS